MQPLVADRFDLMDFGWESVREIFPSKSWLVAKVRFRNHLRSIWRFRSPHINPAVSICVHTPRVLRLHFFNLECERKLSRNARPWLWRNFSNSLNHRRWWQSQGSPWVEQIEWGDLVFFGSKDVSRPFGWPLVGNEGMKLYLVIMGIHSQIPY